MPRKSAAALTVIHGRPSRIAPPDEVPATQRQIFADLVATMPAEHFKPGDAPLLTRYCEAIAMCERAGKEMESTGGPVMPSGRVNPWYAVQQRSAKMVAMLSLRLRMAPSARRDTRTGAAHPQSAYDRIVADADQED